VTRDIPPTVDQHDGHIVVCCGSSECERSAKLQNKIWRYPLESSINTRWNKVSVKLSYPCACHEGITSAGNRCRKIIRSTLQPLYILGKGRAVNPEKEAGWSTQSKRFKAVLLFPLPGTESGLLSCPPRT